MDYPVNTYLLRDGEVKMVNEIDIMSIIYFDWEYTGDITLFIEMGYNIYEG